MPESQRSVRSTMILDRSHFPQARLELLVLPTVAKRVSARFAAQPTLVLLPTPGTHERGSSLRFSFAAVHKELILPHCTVPHNNCKAVSFSFLFFSTCGRTRGQDSESRSTLYCVKCKETGRTGGLGTETPHGALKSLLVPCGSHMLAAAAHV